jgi:phosphoribosylamine---glycine ligase
MNVLVIGSGGREHALLKACLASPLKPVVFAAPGNGGMETDATCFPLEVENVAAAVKLAKDKKIDFAIVGPEVPLALGMADKLREAGVLVYGPNAREARLEASKAFCKEFFFKYNIPTASSRTFVSGEIDEAVKYVSAHELPVVVKASGLAAGKGVIIAQTKGEAVLAVRGMLDGSLFGAAGSEVVVEECLVGEETSILCIVCGDKYIMLPPSQDHKRVGDGDRGPNTGGMGAYAPTTVVTPEIERAIRENVIAPTLAGFRAEGFDYRGTLFIGIMVTKNGPMVLEFNVRFGDPETQVVLPMIDADPFALMLDCAKGTLDPSKVGIKSGSSIIVVLAAKGYPGKYPKGGEIVFPKTLPKGAAIIHAGTKRTPEGRIVSSGGRVLGVTATGDTLSEAAATAYKVVDQIQWADKYCRRDIGYRQIARDKAVNK